MFESTESYYCHSDNVFRAGMGMGINWFDLTIKAPITTAADNIHKFYFHCFSEKIRLDVSSESSARQRIHVKNQVLFSSKDKSKKLKCRLLQFLFGALRVKASWTNDFVKLTMLR